MATLRQLADRYANAAQGGRAAYDRAADRIGRELVRDARGRPAPRRRSGALQNSIRYTYEGRRTGVRISLIAGGPDIRYARIQNRGGVVRARRSPYLTFRLPNGQWRRARQVRIPETGFLAKPVEEAPPTAGTILAEEVTAYLEGRA